MKDQTTLIIVWDETFDYETGSKMVQLLEENEGYYAQGYLSNGCCERCRRTQDDYEIEAFCVDNDKIERFLELLADLRVVYKFEVFKKYEISFKEYLQDVGGKWDARVT